MANIEDEETLLKNVHLEFRKKITEKSVSNKYINAKTEWELIGTEDSGHKENICICKTEIRYLNYIHNKFNGNQLIIGSHCCKHISDQCEKNAYKAIDKLKNPEKYCKICDSKMRKVKNEDHYSCKICDKKLTIGKFKNNHKLYSMVYKNDLSYCRWVESIKNPSGQLADFQDYLIKINRK